jgi:hypothetical protein
MSKRLILIGTDHRIQMSVAPGPTPNTWVPRTGNRFRRLIVYCIEKLRADFILEEAHADQERLAPTICSTIAKERGIAWQALAMGEPDLSDGLIDPPIVEAIQRRIKPEVLAGRYVLKTQQARELFMFGSIMKSFEKHDCILAVVGYVHLGVLANRVDAERVSVEGLLYMYPLALDESRS